MISNFFKTAFRHLLRNRVFTFINLMGLTLGMTCALFAILFVKDEMSYDRFHRNAGRLYRLTTLITHPNDGTQQFVATTGQVQGPAFKSAIPEIADYVRILGSDGLNLTGNISRFAVNNILHTDVLFSACSLFHWCQGNAKNRLTDPHSIVLSEKYCHQIFRYDRYCRQNTYNRRGQGDGKSDGHRGGKKFNHPIRRSEFWTYLSRSVICS